MRVNDVAAQPAAAAGVWIAAERPATPTTVMDATRRQALRAVRSSPDAREEVTAPVSPILERTSRHPPSAGGAGRGTTSTTCAPGCPGSTVPAERPPAPAFGSAPPSPLASGSCLRPPGVPASTSGPAMERDTNDHRVGEHAHHLRAAARSRKRPCASPRAMSWRSTSDPGRSDRAFADPSRSSSGCCLRSTKRGPWPARRPRPGHAPTPGRRIASSRLIVLRGPDSSRFHADRRSSAGSAGPNPPTSSTPVIRPSATSTFVAIRSPWFITSTTSGRGSRRIALPKFTKTWDVQHSHALSEARLHPLVMLAQIAATALPVMGPTLSVDVAHTQNELDDVLGESDAPCGVGVRCRDAMDPGLHRPRQGVARTRLSDCDGLGCRDSRPIQQLSRCCYLCLDPASDRVGIVRMKGEARDESVADPKERVHRPRRRHRLDPQVRPLRELRGDEATNRRRGHVELACVHSHADTSNQAKPIGSPASPACPPRRWTHRFG